MSDLAPFVAAAVRDKVVADLQDENRKLEEVNEERKRGMRLCVTGAHGTPVYAMANINEATIEENEEEEVIKCRLVKLENFENVPRSNSLVDILNAEFWIGEKCKGAVRFADDHSVG